jgi:hypothetical protein
VGGIARVPAGILNLLAGFVTFLLALWSYSSTLAPTIAIHLRASDEQFVY